VEVVDVAGKVVLRATNTNGRVDVSELVPGAYQLLVYGNDGLKQARFTKQ
jgi:uncharacterized surface anchored protein